jgi:hypothetical protein
VKIFKEKMNKDKKVRANLKELIHNSSFDTMLLDTRRLIKINWIKEPDYENIYIDTEGVV